MGDSREELSEREVKLIWKPEELEAIITDAAGVGNLSRDLAHTVVALRKELEQAHVQLAGCGVAALGWDGDTSSGPAKKGDYGWSQSYEDVRELRQKYDKLLAAVPQGTHAAMMAVRSDIMGPHFIRAGDDVRDPTGCLRMIRQLHLEEQWETAGKVFARLDQALSRFNAPMPQQWNPEVQETWLDWDTCPPGGDLKHLELQLGNVRARLKFRDLTTPTSGPDQELNWGVQIVPEEDSGYDKTRFYAVGCLTEKDVPHYYSNRVDDFFAIGRERVYNLMTMIIASNSDG